jgi:hypothetical protein
LTTRSRLNSQIGKNDEDAIVQLRQGFYDIVTFSKQVAAVSNSSEKQNESSQTSDLSSED